MVDSLIPGDKNLKELQAVVDERERQKKIYPDFAKNAEKINVDQQDYLAAARRAYNTNGDLEKGLVYAIGEEVTTFQVGDDRILMLKMRVEENEAAVYVPVSEIGANYRHPAAYIGQRKRIVLGEFVDAGKDEVGNPLFIAYASIREVENALGQIIYDQFQEDPEAAKSQDRIGVITEVVATGDVNMIFFDYQGISLTMLERDYHYRTYLHPLEEDAHVGQKIKFRITNVTKDDYDKMRSVIEDKKRGRLTPEGDRFYIQTTRLPYLPNPDDRIVKLANQHSYFLARVVNWNPIKGVIVEIGPGWWVKGYIAPGSHISLSMNDAIRHTRVVVVINRINLKTRSGQVYIRATPDGVAPRTPDVDLDNRILAENSAQVRSKNPVETGDDNDQEIDGQKIEPEVPDVRPEVQPEDQPLINNDPQE